MQQLSEKAMKNKVVVKCNYEYFEMTDGILYLSSQILL